MKRTILAVCLLASSSFLFAQISFGIKAGINISNFTGGNFEDVEKKSIIGFHGGGFLNFGLGDHFSLQPELLVSTQGARIDSVNGEHDWKLTYITVPIMAKYKFSGSFFVEAGPQFGFKISEDIDDQTIEEFGEELDVSIGVGLGLHTKSGFGIGVRYLAGVSKVGKFESSNIDPDFKNSVLQIGLFFTLGGKK
jgi:hypothetical protein